MMSLGSKKKREIVGQMLLGGFLSISLFVFVLPFLVMITNSFETFNFALPYPPKIFPDNPNFAGYEHVINLSIFWPSVKNSVINTLITVVVCVFISTLSAYGFGRIDFPFREPLFKLYLFTLMVPTFLNIIPQFLILKSVVLPNMPNGLVGTRVGLILVYTATNIAGHTFFLRGFFRSVKNELSESVLIDGGGHAAIFLKIMLPMCKPAIGTMTIFAIQGYWEEYFTARVLVGTVPKMVTFPMLMQQLRFENQTRFDWMFSASIMALIPTLIIFVVFQKKFVVGGLLEGAVKE